MQAHGRGTFRGVAERYGHAPLVLGCASGLRGNVCASRKEEFSWEIEWAHRDGDLSVVVAAQ